jgi:putative ABC transport system ATP-binding protein
MARALSNHPKLLLADEPTGNLDQDTGQEIVELMFRVQRERAMTLLLITHEPRLAARCDEQLRMADGRLQGLIAGPQLARVSSGNVA